MIAMGYNAKNIKVEALFEPALRAIAALTRLDERLRSSPVREGFTARMAFHEAIAAMWLGGELVHLEDLVLHDAHMDIRAPTHELTLAHQVLRAIRQVAVNTPDWALSRNGLQSLRGQKAQAVNQSPQAAGDTFLDLIDDGHVSPAAQELDRDLADMDARLKRLDAVLERTANGGRAVPGDIANGVARNGVFDATLSANGLNPLIYDEDGDAEEHLAGWQSRLLASHELPSVVRAAFVLDDWNQNEILPRAPGLGPLLAASLLRGGGKQSGKANGQKNGQGFVFAHLPALNMSLRQIPRERRNAKDQSVRLVALLEAFEHSALIGLKEHDRLALARTQMQRKLKGKRANSKLPQLIELVLSRPLVTSTMIERELKVTMQGALNLLAELSLREVTGRGRFRAWAVV